MAVVTGAGKTLFGLHCFAAIKQSVSDLRVAVIVPTLALMDQWAVALQEDLGLDPADIGTFSGEGHASGRKTANVLVLNTAREVIAELAATGEWMLIVDECHRAGTPANARALQGQFVAALGLSATPERDFDLGFAAILEPILGPIVFRYEHDEAIADGVIARFELLNVEVPLTVEEAVEYSKFTRLLAAHARSGDERVAAIARRRARIAIMARLRVPVAIAVLNRERAKCIVFHERISEAERLAHHLEATNRRPTTYHSGIVGNERRERLRLFRGGTFDTLVTCRSLDEGLNVPDVSIGVIVASTGSRRQRIQRMGRTLRASTPDKLARVITLYATEIEKRRLETEEQALVDVVRVRWITAAVQA